jgi:Tfp pilus assembly protein PilN
VATYTDPTTIVSTGKAEPIQPAVKVLLAGSLLTILVAGVFAFQIVSSRREVLALSKDIVAARLELDKLAGTATELSELQQQAEGLRVVFASQKRWPAVLEKFSERLHRSMSVTSLQMTDKGQVALAGTVPDYETYAKVFNALTDTEGKKYFATAKPTSVAKVADPARRTSYVSFAFNLTLQPAVLNSGAYTAAVSAAADDSQEEQE